MEYEIIEGKGNIKEYHDYWEISFEGQNIYDQRIGKGNLFYNNANFEIETYYKD